MVRSRTAGIRHRSRVMACAIVFTLGTGAAGQAAAQAAMLSMQYVGAPALANDTGFRPLVREGDDCDEAPVNNGYTMVLARAQLKKPARSARGKKADGAADTPMAAAAAVAAAGFAADAQRDWEIIVTDKTLNATMARWAALAGWQLLWELPVDYAVEARTRVHGTFEEAVGIVAASMESAEIPMKAVFYQGNRVLRIMSKGTE